MATIRFKDNWVQFNSHENQCFEDEEEEEEALSLCDLPINNNEFETNSKDNDKYDQEDFEFGSCHAAAANKSPENMCNADDIFFQGQILPLRHSVSSETKSIHTRIINRSASLTDPRTKRSNGYGYRIRNQFHSHPSPSPQIRTQSFRTLSHSTHKTSSLWSFLQVGLVKPQEIGLSDLKNRSKRFGSHNSNSSSTSSSMNSTIDQNQNKTQNPRINTKKKQRLFFGSGCKCSVSVDSITNERTIKETVVQKNKTTTNMSKESTMIGGERKQTMSRHRTFEWLKQLSIAAPSEA